MLRSLKKLFKDAMDGMAVYATSGACGPVTEEVMKVHVELQEKLAEKQQTATPAKAGVQL